ncbi:MAG TPA: class I SAM-dependent methyltransferase [Gemmataceae bacterium]|nr:class I SAM-dependent methyltransferase [Gemmataceae bacterium]
MRIVDRLLQAWRAWKARPWITAGARVLDIGCHQGEFLRGLGDHIGPSTGLDPLARPEAAPRFRIVAEPFREPTGFADESFDAVVLLATLEHVPDKEPLARECRRILTPGGRVIVTVPTPFVDRIVEWLCRLRLADGMSLDEHHGFDPSQTPAIFTRHGFDVEHAGWFQLGLNRLFVFRKRPESLSSLGEPADSTEQISTAVHA